MRNTIFIFIALAAIAITIAGFWDFLSSSFFPSTTWGLYNKSFFESFLVEIHGGIFDLAVVGIILYWFDRKRTKKKVIAELKERLKNLTYYKGIDASYQFFGVLKSLQDLGVESITTPEAIMNDLTIYQVSLRESNLIAIDLSRSKLNKVTFTDCEMMAGQFIDTKFLQSKFENCNLKRSKFVNARMNGIDFRGNKLRGALFKNCHLKSSDFRGLDCSGMSFKGSNLRSANFRGAKNLTQAMIKKAAEYNYIKLPENIDF